MTTLTFYGDVGEIDRKLREIVERSIEQAIGYFSKNQEKFGNEQQFQELLYYILANELQKENMLFAKTKDGRDLILLVREKITKEKYKRGNAKKETHGRLDIAILYPNSRNFPKDGEDLKRVPLSIGIETKLNKTDSGWKDEMEYLFDKLKREVTSPASGRYIIFLSTREKFEFEEEYRKWLSNQRDVKVYSNKKELESMR